MTRDYSVRAADRAQYLPAGQTGTHSLPSRPASTVRGGHLPPCLPNGLRDLDWLDPASPFFSSDRALFSAGQYIGRSSTPGMFSRRPGVTILCDSGGLQYGRGRDPWLYDASRDWSLRFLEANADEAITLDIPTIAITQGPPIFDSFQACLNETLANNAYFHAHRTREDLRFFNVIQGTKSAEAVDWYDAIKARPFEGWAFAGALRRDYLHVAAMVVRMIADGMLVKQQNRLHFLGVSRLTDAVMLSAFQRALREHLDDPALKITFDTSSPSKLAMAGQAFAYPLLSPTDFRIASWRPPSGHVHAGSTYRFATASSRLGEQLTIGDLCVAAATRQHGWDALGNELIVNHNTEAMFRAIEDANAVVEMPTKQASQLAPDYVIRAYNAVRGMFRHRDPISHLRRIRSDFEKL